MNNLIKTKIIDISHPEALEIARTTLFSGGLVAFPTDTVYGLAALVHDGAGINKLFDVKGRDSIKAIAVLIGDMAQLPLIADDFTGPARKLAQMFWPGALTLIVPRLMDLPDNLSPYPTIGIRMPNHPFAISLLKITGPLATTSANLSGGENPVCASDVENQLGGAIELILDGGQTPGPIPSTVVDCAGPIPQIIRDGMITAEEISASLNQP